MTRGNNPVYFILFLAAAVVAAFMPENQPARAAGNRGDSEPVREVFLREAYYHFYLSDYLGSATRLKLIEKSEGSAGDQKTLDEVRSLLGGLYFAWDMDRTGREVFSGLVSEMPRGYDRDRLLYRVERIEYGKRFYGHAAETFELIHPESEFPGDDQARYMAGMSYRALGSLKRSLEVLKTVPDSSPYFPYSRYAAAQADTGLEDYDGAIRNLKALAGMKTGKDSVLASFRDKSRLTLGQLYLERGDFDSALEALSAIGGNSPFRPEALYATGWARFNSGRTREALLDFEELIRNFPDHPYAVEALTVRANCYARLKADRSALTAYREAVDAYAGEADAYREARDWAGDSERLRGWLDAPVENPAPKVPSLLRDEGLRFRVGQYRELSALEAYFNRKLADMEVFNVILDHRESVYRSRLPEIEKFLEGKSVERLIEKGASLRSGFEKSVRAESGVLGLLMRDEAESLEKIDRALAEVARLKERIGKRPPGPETKEASDRLKAVERWLNVFRGEILWASITSLPARSDDADRQIAGLTANLEKLKERKERLIRSISAMRDRLAGFRKAIPGLREELKAERDRTAAIRKNLLGPLQSMLIRTIDDRLGYYDQLAAYARFGQIQVMDKEKK